MSAERASPYQGLIPYTITDQPYFFGRDADRELIIANLIAARLTVLYGASGVGKSSVLQAGAVHDLRAEATQRREAGESPECMVVSLNTWRDDPLLRLVERLREGAEALGLAVAQSPERLSDTLSHYAKQLPGGVLLILDQFEEYFLYHPDEDGEGTFAVEFPRAVNRLDLAANFLISIRDDSIAGLDRFKGRIPSLFSNYLRIEHLNREAAREAIVMPVNAYTKANPRGDHPVEVERGLVDAVLDQVRTGQVRLGQVGGGTVGTDRSKDDARIETPYLQVVMTRLWEEEVAKGSRKLRLATLTYLGGAERIVRTHLDRAMEGLSQRQQDTAAAMFHYLVTPSGTKIAHTTADLAEYARVTEADVRPVVKYLADSGVRVLRPVSPPPIPGARVRYEIFHDVLAAAILDWRTRFIRAPFRWRVGLYAASPVVLIGVAVFAWMWPEPARQWVIAAVIPTLFVTTAVTVFRMRRLRPMYGLLIGFTTWVCVFVLLAIVDASLRATDVFGGIQETLPLCGLCSAIGFVTGAIASLTRVIQNFSWRWQAGRSARWIEHFPLRVFLGGLMTIAGCCPILLVVSVIFASSGRLSGRELVGFFEPIVTGALVSGCTLLGGAMASALWAQVERPGRWLPIVLVGFIWTMGAAAVLLGLLGFTSKDVLRIGLAIQVLAPSVVLFKRSADPIEDPTH